MSRRRLIGAVAALLTAASLISCVRSPKPGTSSSAQSSSQFHTVSAQVPAHDSGRHIVLPNPQLMACRKPDCYQVLTDQPTDAGAVYPWQVLVDFNGNQVIGLVAFYDQPTSMDDLQVAVDERYGQWAVADFRTGPARIWRIEPEKFVIQLGRAHNGMVQLIYLMFDPNHPTSKQVEEQMFRTYCKDHPDADCTSGGFPWDRNH